MSERIILGIDPGTNLMGYGLIHMSGKTVKLIALGTVELNKIIAHEEKLKKIYERVSSLIKEYKAEECALEAPFYGKNAQSMLKLGRAQGVAIAAAVNAGLQIFEYSPRKIKLAITGKGTASKEQVATMLQQTLHFEEKPHYLDATDGLAVAVCHAYQFFEPTTITKKSSFKGWKDFIDKNKEKVK